MSVNLNVASTDTPGFLSDRMYSFLRFLAVILLPALGSAYFALAGIWGLPNAEEVVGTIMVVDTLLGVLVRTARKSYESDDARFDGEIEVAPDPENGLTNLNVSLNPEAIAGKDEILVKIKGK